MSVMTDGPLTTSQDLPDPTDNILSTGLIAGMQVDICKALSGQNSPNAYPLQETNSTGYTDKRPLNHSKTIAK